MLWVFIYKPEDTDTLYEADVIIVEADSKEEAVDKFLGDADEVNSEEFIDIRLGEISDILLHIPENDIADYPLAEQLMDLIDKAKNPYELFRDETFRDLARKVFSDDPNDDNTLPSNIFAILRYDGLNIKRSFNKTKKLIKANDKRELTKMFNYYCENLSNTKKLPELYGMAKAMKIKNAYDNKDDKEWLCSQIGAKIVIYNTGIHAENLVEALNN